MDVIELRLFTWLARVGSGDLAKLHALLCAHRVSKNCPIYFLLRSFFFFFTFLLLLPTAPTHVCYACVRGGKTHTCAWMQCTCLFFSFFFFI